MTLDIVDASNEDRDLQCREIAGASVTDESVQESVRRLQQLAEGSTDHLLLVDRSLRVLFANRHTAGRDPNQLVGHPIDQVLPQRGRDRAVACMHRVLQHGVGDCFEVEWQTPNGSTRFMEVRVGAVREQGTIVALTLNGSDTTSHVLAQRAVATQAKMIESMLEGVALVNAAGSIVITNPAFDSLFGYARGRLIGQSLTALAGGTSLDHSMEAALTGGAGPWALEFDASRHDGTTVTVAGALSRLDDSGRTHLLLVL
ncbi:MAG TPA: PAS domain S-box protein, partial [Steroidobacteraceae bacterium]|nr:PAS domain S-box protein [Steroidobacteraceae bacterium]